MTLDTAPIAFYNRTFDDAVVLLREARDYIAWREPELMPTLDISDRLDFSIETTRMTSRLTHCIAWLLAQRAVQSGEITWSEALSNQTPLSDVRVCTELGRADNQALPDGLRDLLGRCRALYVRISRLDELARRDHLGATVH